MKKITLILFLLLPLSSFSKSEFDKGKVSKEITEIISHIENNNFIDAHLVGFIGKKTEKFGYFLKFRDKATKKELIALTDHPSPAVRSYAFIALASDASNTSNDLQLIIENHIQDSEHVTIHSGCEVWAGKVGDIFIDIVTPSHYEDFLGESTKLTKFSKTEFQELDQLLLSIPNNLEAKARLFNSLKPNQEIYSKIRVIVEKEKDPLAAVLLARYKKEQDVNIILKTMKKPFDKDHGYNYTYDAITIFPHKKFFPLLEEHLKKMLLSDERDISMGKKLIFKAIANYRNELALELLQTPFKLKKTDSDRKDYLGRVLEAIKYSEAPIYDELLWRLWGEENLLSLNVFRYLSKKDSDKAFKYSKKMFLDGNYAEALTDAMLEFIKEKDSKLAVEFVTGRLYSHAGDYSARLYIEKSGEWMNKDLVRGLLEQIEATERSPKMALKAANILLTYHDDETDKKTVIKIKNVIDRVKKRILLPYESFLHKLEEKTSGKTLGKIEY